jgi:hypothetical protein
MIVGRNLTGIHSGGFEQPLDHDDDFEVAEDVENVLGELFKGLQDRVSLYVHLRLTLF